MVTLAMCLGLRVSEILGLSWEDIDLEGGRLQIRRSVVNGRVEDTKTEASEDELPLHSELVHVLREWREAEQPVNGWLFGNLDTGKPYHSDTMRQRHLNRAAAEIGLPKLVGTPSGTRIGLGCPNLDCLWRSSRSSCATPPST